MLLLHGALWLLLGRAERSARATGAGVAAVLARADAGLPVLQVSLLGELPRVPTGTPAAAGAMGLATVAEMPQAPMQALPQIVMLAAEADAAPLDGAGTPPEAAVDRPDRPALPLTAPDLSSLAALSTSGSAIRLRLHIGADGTVREVELLACAPDDQAFADRLALILRATPHIPARKGGQDVASIKDIELAFAGGA